MVSTGNPEIARILRSVRSHGRPPGESHFDFQRFGTNSKMNDLEAAIGLEGVATFREVFATRKANVQRLLALTDDLADVTLRLREEPHEIISPHAFPIVLRDPSLDCGRLYRFLEGRGIQCKTLFGSLPTQHGAFAFLGHRRGEFPVAEYIGENGLHFGCHQFLSEEDLVFISDMLHEYFAR